MTDDQTQEQGEQTEEIAAPPEEEEAEEAEEQGEQTDEQQGVGVAPTEPGDGETEFRPSSDFEEAVEE